jgi:hypothetical protein
MKRIAIAMLFWGIIPAVLAQSQYQQATDAAIVNLDKSGVTSGILYDRVFPFANLYEPSAPSSPGHFRQAHAELFNASYNTANRINPQHLTDLIWESEQHGIVPIGVLVTDMQRFKTDAIELDNNKQYRLKSGYNAGQLYQTTQVAVASALSYSIGYTTVTYQLPLWAIYTQNNLTVSNIIVDFGDGSPPKTLIPGNKTVQVQYNSLGEKTIRCTINLSDGSQRTAVSTLIVTDPYNRGGIVYSGIPANGAITNGCNSKLFAPN